MNNCCRQKDHRRCLTRRNSYTLMAAAFGLSTQLAGCATMIFHNGPTSISDSNINHNNNETIHIMATGVSPITAITPTQESGDFIRLQTNDPPLIARPNSPNIEEFEHEVKTSEHILHYIGGQSTSAITLSQWCSPKQWRAFKTEQSAVDMIVRWIASPLYAINSLALSCSDKSTPALPGVDVPANLANREKTTVDMPVKN